MLDLEGGSINIGSSDMLMHAFLLPYLERFHKAHPKIRITTVTLSTHETLAALRAQKIDVGVLFSPVSKSDDVELRQDMFIAGKPFRHLEGRVLPLAEIVKMPIVCPRKDTSSRQYLDAFFHAHGLVLAPEFELATTVLIVPFVERGLGVGITVRRFAEESLKEGTVFELRASEPFPPRTVSVATRKKGLLSSAGREFLRCLTDTPPEPPHV